MARPEVGQVVAWYICTVTASLFLITRLVIRWRLFKRFYVDDYLLAIANLCLICDLVIQHYMFNLGMSDPEVKKEEMVEILKMVIPGSTLYVTSLWLIKAGMVIFYKRLADRTKYQMIYNITLGFLAATWLTIFLNIIFKCFPPNRIWDLDHPERACSHKQSRINYWITILFNICSDVFIICLPISQVLKLKLPKKQKIGVLSIFMLGFLVVISSIIRAIYAWKNEQMITCTVSMVETTIAIIASCLPVMRTLFFGSKSRTGTYSGGRGYALSSSGHIGAGKQKSTVSASNIGVRSKSGLSRHDSEDELVREGASPALDAPNSGISVTREYFVHEGMRDTESLR
ncbi:hypothetical protein EYZ11_006693 [Aspergillus tanneri]|uniref:Rhodopsin domain-containing protein n=1 Tax=Aspergillus tanneri TaxID=1220188 RepID=A0A4S3JKK0_9EURO|nr:uncharacterized protein ATNIH1004_009379 [Aspergillus tanneri]KAA8645162.1 hypothetical protein ATNIH1004_009379 [Aspergillus tanneri]THC93841.1 hypothetical protein EYZ11_006693 [Aspergillus tanneri]